MKPIWEEIEKEMQLNTIYYDFDVYEDMLKEKYHIKDKLPIIIIQNDKEEELERIIGEIKKDDLLQKLRMYDKQ